MSKAPKANKKSLLSAFLEHRSTLAAYLAQHLLKPEDIDDILQETITRALAKESDAKILSPKSYLFIVARNLMSRQLSQQTKKLAREIEDLDLNIVPSDSASIENIVDGRKKLEKFKQAVDTLPPQCRRVFLLRKLYGWPHKRIAAHLGISPSTVERHITIAISRLDERQRQNNQETEASKILKFNK